MQVCMFWLDVEPKGTNSPLAWKHELGDFEAYQWSGGGGLQIYQDVSSVFVTYEG